MTGYSRKRTGYDWSWYFKLIAIVDYGVGNLGSVENAFRFIGVNAVATSSPEKISAADAVVLPGVGAYAGAAISLEKAGLTEVIKDVIKKEKLFLGICLGMQLLFEYSEEGGQRAEGLGIFRGSIEQLPFGNDLKIPHMGWNSLNIKNKCPLFEGLPERPYVYFVHSYYLNNTCDRDIVAATADYGIEFNAAVWSGNVFATQFHPEKSGDVGLKILKNWTKLVYRA